MVRRGRKWRRRRRTKIEMKASVNKAKASDPIEDFMLYLSKDKIINNHNQKNNYDKMTIRFNN